MRTRLAAALLALALTAAFAPAALAAWPTGMWATSTLPVSDYGTYYAENICDGNLSTAWVEGVAGPGIGEYVELYYPAGTVVYGGTVFPGYWKTESLFYENNVPTRLRVESGGQQRWLDLTPVQNGYYEGYPGFTFSFTEPLVSDGTVRVVIEEVRSGWNYDDTCISELQFVTGGITWNGEASVTLTADSRGGLVSLAYELLAQLGAAEAAPATTPAPAPAPAPTPAPAPEPAATPTYTPDQLCSMALDYYQRHSGYRPSIADYEVHEDGKYLVHLYDMVERGGIGHTATSAWYLVDATGVGTDEIFGNPVDLSQ